MKKIIQGVLRRLKSARTSILKALLGCLSITRVHQIADAALLFRIRCHEVIRQKIARGNQRVVPEITSHDGRSTIFRTVLEKHTPWSALERERCSIPGMLSVPENQYYQYLSRFYRGLGSVVELGPWLGLSTHILIKHLKKNPAFEGEKLYVFDDFTWRSSWMNRWLKDTKVPIPENHECFLPIFKRNVDDDLAHLEIRRCKIADYDGNENLPMITWDGGCIELLVVDCGRQLHVNEAWYQVFSPFFIPNQTLIVMQDWQNYKRIPEEFWENTKLFTDSKQGSLDMIHEVSGAGIATFLYRGD